jgi:hypothetical protein
MVVVPVVTNGRVVSVVVVVVLLTKVNVPSPVTVPLDPVVSQIIEYCKFQPALVWLMPTVEEVAVAVPISVSDVLVVAFAPK